MTDKAGQYLPEPLSRGWLANKIRKTIQAETGSQRMIGKSASTLFAARLANGRNDGNEQPPKWAI
jgi:hypothetical protein